MNKPILPTMPVPIPVRTPSGPQGLNTPAMPERLPSTAFSTTPGNPTPLGPGTRRVPSGPRGDAPMPTPTPTRIPR